MRWRRGRCRQPVERDGEAELERAALQRVCASGGTAASRPGSCGGRAGARLAQQAGRRGEQRGGDVERRGLAVPSPSGLVDGPRQRRRRLRRKRLLDGAEIRPHRRRAPLINRSGKLENNPSFAGCLPTYYTAWPVPYFGAALGAGASEGVKGEAWRGAEVREIEGGRGGRRESGERRERRRAG